jgi:hypothetical protein
MTVYLQSTIIVRIVLQERSLLTIRVHVPHCHFVAQRRNDHHVEKLEAAIGYYLQSDSIISP